MTRRRTFLLFALFGTTLWSLGYGPLFPWSPVHPGYQEISGNRVTVIWPSDSFLPEGLRNADAILGEAEHFHRLQAPSHITVIICRDWNGAYRMLPRMVSRGVGGVALATGTVIYITPKIAESRLDSIEYVRHEMSHAVLHQNQSLRGALQIGRTQWLAEGLAVWFGRQKSYISDDEFRRMAPSKDLAAYIDPDLRDRIAEPFSMRFAYICWKHFNAHLEGRAPERYWRFVHAAMKQPPAWRELFAEHMGESFADAISRFSGVAAQVPTEASVR